MIIELADAAYFLAVINALSNIHPEHLTDRCPECGETMTRLDNDEHIVTDISDLPGTRKDVAVIVGCEGYWVIDPALVGIDRPTWQPATTDPPEADDHGCEAEQ